MNLPERLDQIANALLATKDYSTFAHAIYQAAIELRASSSYVPSDDAIAAMRAARDALATCYEVQSYPGDGKTVQDGAIAQLDAVLSSCEECEGKK
jgi:hypothetical protein